MSNVVTLNNSSPEIQYLCTKDKRLEKVISMVGEITYTVHTDPYVFLIHEIIEQMLSIKAGNSIFCRLENLCNGSITIDSISKLSDAQIRSTGTSAAKVTCIRNLTNDISSGSLNLNALSAMSDEQIIKRLTLIHGIGNWTAKMYLIFVLNRPDILPFEDGAFLQVYRWMYKTSDCTKTSITKRCKKWKPYSSLASRYLYRALDYGFTKKEFHLFK